MKNAMDYAIWFMKNGKDSPRNTKEGNMKLQKLLYFSQLIHLTKYNKPLFGNSMYAFKQGTVVEDVRQSYQRNINMMIAATHENEYEMNDEEKYSLNAVMDIFGECGAEELSIINHEQDTWKLSYNRSKRSNNYHEKEDGIIQLSDIMEYDFEKVNEMLRIYEIEKAKDEECILVNGINFYFDPTEIHIDGSVMKQLENFTGEDMSYYVYNDESAGVVIY